MKCDAVWTLLANLILILLLVMSGCGGGGGGSIPSTSTISGVVGEAHYGNPIAGATVEVVSTTRANTPSVTLQATTNENGVYSITDVPAGKVKIRTASQDGSFRSLETEINLTGGTTFMLSPNLIRTNMAEPASLTVEPQDLTVAVGEVAYLDVNATPYAKHFFWVEGDVGQMNASGNFVATKPGVGVVVVQAGTLTARATVTVKATGSYGVIRGTVTDQAGNPIPEARITSDDRLAAYTDASGMFAIPRVPGGEYSMTVTRAGYENLQSVVTVVPNQTTTVSWKLRPKIYQNLRISPTTVTLGVGDTHTFVVSADNSDYPYMKFTLLESGGGSLNESYLLGRESRYTAPDVRGTYHLVATSVTDPNQRVTATITVQAGGGTVIVE